MVAQTIIALASGNLPAGIGILRVSGPECLEILACVLATPILPNCLKLRNIIDPVTDNIIDTGMVYFAPGPNSFTGEDVIEFHLHGSLAIMRKMIAVLLNFDNVVLAQAGEFTKRAFENSKLDLSEVEGLGDLLHAETEGQRVQAMSRYHGGISRLIDSWRAVLTATLSQIEANLDFSDEEDVLGFDLPQNTQSLETLRREIALKLQGYQGARIVREGFRVGVAGLPNVGKSSLINALTKSNQLIVTEEAGTTRDLHEVQFELNGQLIILIDSAGIRKSSSIAETEGVRRSIELLAFCDLVVWVSALDVMRSEIVPDIAGPVIHVSNKADLGEGATGLLVGAKGGNVEPLLEALQLQLDELSVGAGSQIISRERDKLALEAGIHHLDKALSLLNNSEYDLQLEFVAEELRLCLYVLERLLGKVDSEAILGEIFTGFCIGK